MSAMRLEDLLRGIATPGSGDILVSGLTQDSRAVRAGDAFVALAGVEHHGIEFAPVAVEQGAVVVLAEKPGPGTGDRGPETPASRTSVSPAQPADLNTNQYESRKAPVTTFFGPRSPVPGPIGTAESAATKREGRVGIQVPSAWSGPRSPVPGPVVWIDDLRTHLGEIAARFHGDPSAALTVVGVTGTSGKTSTVQLLAQALAHLGQRAATIGTLGAGLHGAIHAGERTTPDVIRVHGLLAEFRDAGTTHVAMEVSSHALDQHRVDGVHFDVAAFTNLTRDHLDYHRTMEAYGAAKAKLFAWPDLRAAVINVDDAFGRELATQVPADVQVIRCGIDAVDASVRALDVHTHSGGLAFELETPWGKGRLRSRLIGRFNIANLLAVAGTLGALEVPFEQIHDALEHLEAVSGRMIRLGGGALPLVVVDYSHKPDALEQVLGALRAHCQGKLICVFGCGGERDAGKRPLMGAIAERLADVVIVTDDNPRGEDGEAIAVQILTGMRAPQSALVERDRARAIALGIARAGAGDVVLIAGKGHETYQECAGVKRPFDDFKVARAALEARPC